MEKEITYKVLPVRVESGKYKQLRKLAYLSEMSMAELIRRMLDEKLNSMKKVLTNSDIAI